MVSTESLRKLDIFVVKVGVSVGTEGLRLGRVEALRTRNYLGAESLRTWGILGAENLWSWSNLGIKVLWSLVGVSGDRQVRVLGSCRPDEGGGTRAICG